MLKREATKVARNSDGYSVGGIEGQIARKLWKAIRKNYPGKRFFHLAGAQEM
jgi:CRISPR/Cas system-associated endonuclease Cas1